MASSPAQPTAASQQPTIAFVLRPQPVTLWFQFDDSSQLGVNPSPERIATSIFRMPMMGGMPILMVPGLFGGAGGSGNFERQLHELFLRTQNEQHGPPPTSKDFLDKIPLKTWNEKMKQAEKHVECSICLCDYEENDQVMPLPCGHQFHKECGMKWLLEHNVCPTCRYALPTQDATVPTPETAANALPASTPVTTVSPAEPAPSPEPEAEEHVAQTPSRVRQRSPRHTPQRVVRRRISEMESVVLPSHSTEDDAMDNLLEEEASRFIAEEQEKQRIAHVTFDDRDVEDLMHDTSV